MISVFTEASAASACREVLQQGRPRCEAHLEGAEQPCGTAGKDQGVFLQNQVAQNYRPLYFKVDQNSLKVAQNYRPLDFKVAHNSLKVAQDDRPLALQVDSGNIAL